MRPLKNSKLQIASLIILLSIYLVLFFQTFSRANRTEGYDFKNYLISSEALWEGSNLNKIGSPFPYIRPLFLAAILAPFVFIPYWLSNLLFRLINILELGAIYVIIVKLFSKKNILILNHSFSLLFLSVIIL
jgi:hypothetical protein